MQFLSNSLTKSLASANLSFTSLSVYQHLQSQCYAVASIGNTFSTSWGLISRPMVSSICALQLRLVCTLRGFAAVDSCSLDEMEIHASHHAFLMIFLEGRHWIWLKLLSRYNQPCLLLFSPPSALLSTTDVIFKEFIRRLLLHGVTMLNKLPH